MFEHAIEIQAESKPVKDLIRANDDLAHRLDKLHKDLVRKLPSVHSRLQACAYIAKGTRDSPYQRGEEHRRSQFMPFNGGYVVAKGSGVNDWQRTYMCKGVSLEYTGFGLFNKGKVRKYPIVKKHIDPKKDYWNHQFLGGLSFNGAAHEFVNSLYVIECCSNAGVPIPNTFPISVNVPQEMPILENGKVKIVDKEEYCKQTFKNDENKNGRVLMPSEFDSLALLNYFSTVPFQRVGYICGKGPVFETRVQNISDIQRKSIVEIFATRLGSTVGAVHLNNGTFTEFNNDNGLVSISSLAGSNVSMDAEVLDLDTVSFGHPKATTLRKRDLRHAIKTVAKFSAYNDVFSVGKNYRTAELTTPTGNRQLGAVGELDLINNALEKFEDVYNSTIRRSKVAKRIEVDRILPEQLYTLF